jgi:hypothetical protein
MHDRLGSDVAAGARPVFSDEWVAEPLRQPLTDQAREDVVRAAAGKADDHANWLRRIGFCPCHARSGWKRDCTRRHMEELAAQQGHGIVLSSELSQRTLLGPRVNLPAVERGYGMRLCAYNATF